MLTTHYATTVEIVINERKSRGDLSFTRIGPRLRSAILSLSTFHFIHRLEQTNVLVDLWQ